MKRASLLLWCLAHAALACGAFAAGAAHGAPGKKAAQAVLTRAVRDGEAEVRLIEIDRLIGQAQSRQALEKAQALVKDHPNFQLAQLVYGDLLTAQARPQNALGDVPDEAARSGAFILG